MHNKDTQRDVRQTLNTDAKLHLNSLKHRDHVVEHSLLDRKIAQDIANNNMPAPSKDFIDSARDILGDVSHENNDSKEDTANIAGDTHDHNNI